MGISEVGDGDPPEAGDARRSRIVDDAEIDQLADAARYAQRLRVAARRAVGFARRYRDEEGPGGERERACLEQAFAWRRMARAPRVGPGLARTVAPTVMRRETGS